MKCKRYLSTYNFTIFTIHILFKKNDEKRHTDLLTIIISKYTPLPNITSIQSFLYATTTLLAVPLTNYLKYLLNSCTYFLVFLG